MMLRNIIVSAFICMSTIVVADAEYDIPKYAPRHSEVNFSFAKQYCDESPLDNVEGIWTFIEDGIDLLIRRKENENRENCYELIVLQSADKSLKFGTVIGYMFKTADVEKFRLFLYTESSIQGVVSPKECVAILSKDNYQMTFEGKELKVRINVAGLLPHLWKVIRYKIENPASELKKGFLKIYPSYDGNGSSLYDPRYL